MYVSHVVRSIVADPIPDEEVRLLLRLSDDADADTVAAAVRDAGGSVENHLEFETLDVAVPQTAVEAICDLDGIDAVETAGTLGIDLDGAGEDVEY